MFADSKQLHSQKKTDGGHVPSIYLFGKEGNLTLKSTNKTMILFAVYLGTKQI